MCKNKEKQLLGGSFQKRRAQQTAARKLPEENADSHCASGCTGSDTAKPFS